MNLGMIMKVIKFIKDNWSLIMSAWSLIKELMKLFQGNTQKVKECIDGVCDAAKKSQPSSPAPSPSQPKAERRSLLRRLLRRK
jgi:hypothetical protein